MTWNWPRIKRFLIANHLPLGLIFMLFFGIMFPEVGKSLPGETVNSVSIVGIFLIAGLQLATEDIKNALSAVPAYVFGFMSILIFSPLLSFWIVNWDLGPSDLAKGMAIFMAMPTTNSSGMVLTAEARGNVALSVLFAVGTNILGVFTVPFFITEILPESGEVSLSPWTLLWKLLLTILLPLAIGKALRRFDQVITFVSAYKTHLKILSSFLLCLVPFVSISNSSDSLGSGSFSILSYLFFVGAGLHAFLLVANYGGIILINKFTRFKIDVPEQKAVVINSSQKTMNTAMAVIALIPPEMGDQGLLLLPCLMGHLAQILMDAVIASRWRKLTETIASPQSAQHAPVVLDATSVAVGESTSSAHSVESSVSSSVSDGAVSDANQEKAIINLVDNRSTDFSRI